MRAGGECRVFATLLMLGKDSGYTHHGMHLRKGRYEADLVQLLHVNLEMTERMFEDDAERSGGSKEAFAGTRRCRDTAQHRWSAHAAFCASDSSSLAY